MYNFNGSGAVCRQQRRFLSEALEGAPGEARGGGSSRLIRRTGPGLPNLHLVVSVDGPQPEHDRRRAPATYDRVMRHIAGHSVIIHCNVTRQMTAPTGYLTEFSRTWSGRPEVRKIWFSLYTPQDGDQIGGAAQAGRPRSGGVRDRQVTEVPPKGRGARRRYERISATTFAARGMHLCPDNRMHFRRSCDTGHALPVRRPPRMRRVWLHGVGGIGGNRQGATSRSHLRILNFLGVPPIG